MLADQSFALKMDDAFYGTATLALQKDSEFLSVFIHYILKTMESGLLRKNHLKHFADLFVKDNFEMIEPLGYNNVMFPFICLGVGICLSFAKVIAEIVVMKMTRQRE